MGSVLQRSKRGQTGGGNSGNRLEHRVHGRQSGRHQGPAHEQRAEHEGQGDDDHGLVALDLIRCLHAGKRPADSHQQGDDGEIAQAAGIFGVKQGDAQGRQSQEGKNQGELPKIAAQHRPAHGVEQGTLPFLSHESASLPFLSPAAQRGR